MMTIISDSFRLIIDDHTVININALQHGRFLTVRTLTENDGESHDSTPIDLDDVLKKVSLCFADDLFIVLLFSTSWIWKRHQRSHLFLPKKHSIEIPYR
jgi:hypothetical protein